MKVLRHILHVEDEPDIRDLAALVLDEAGHYTVTSCATGAEALTAVQASPPDLVLLDAVLPDMDGLTLLRRFRALNGLAALPAVFVTAKTDADELASLRASGAIGIVTKPFDPMTLARTLQGFWDRHAGVVAAAASGSD